MTAYKFDVTVIQLIKERIKLMLENYSQFPLSCFQQVTVKHNNKTSIFSRIKN